MAKKTQCSRCSPPKRGSPKTELKRGEDVSSSRSRREDETSSLRLSDYFVGGRSVVEIATSRIPTTPRPSNRMAKKTRCSRCSPPKRGSPKTELKRGEDVSSSRSRREDETSSLRLSDYFVGGRSVVEIATSRIPTTPRPSNRMAKKTQCSRCSPPKRGSPKTELKRGEDVSSSRSRREDETSSLRLSDYFVGGRSVVEIATSRIPTTPRPSNRMNSLPPLERGYSPFGTTAS